MIKKIIFMAMALAIAVGVGIGVFFWTGGDPDEIRRKGEEVQKQIEDAKKRGTQAADDVKKTIKEVPVPNLPVAQPSAKPLPQTVPPQPQNNTQTAAPKPVPSAPPQEDVNEKDKDKLENILNQ